MDAYRSRILFVRHGTTTYNRQGRIQGQTDVPLTPLGKQQARKIAERLSSEPLERIYTSPLTRASRTAEIVAEPHGLAPFEISGLAERTLGEYEGKNATDVLAQLKRRGLSWCELKPEDGEGWTEFADRALTTISCIAEAHDGETVVIVTHSEVNKAILSRAMFSSIELRGRINQDNGAVNELRTDSGNSWQVISINDTSHL